MNVQECLQVVSIVPFILAFFIIVAYFLGRYFGAAEERLRRP